MTFPWDHRHRRAKSFYIHSNGLLHRIAYAIIGLLFMSFLLHLILSRLCVYVSYSKARNDRAGRTARSFVPYCCYYYRCLLLFLLSLMLCVSVFCCCCVLLLLLLVDLSDSFKMHLFLTNGQIQCNFVLSLHI